MSCSFKDRVFAVVAKIPCGDTLSYKEVAERAGNPNAYRAVGNILHKNHDKNIPCHRVIRADGSVGGYNKGLSLKKIILEKERNSRKKIFSG
ncbi:MAG: MGMT family protein [Patescibacteria group bacterium]|jgi:O-6-methylguanine DNA methyltransferase